MFHVFCGQDMSGEHARSDSDPTALGTWYTIWAKFMFFCIENHINH